jgi:hypothetical protein
MALSYLKQKYGTNEAAKDEGVWVTLVDALQVKIRSPRSKAAVFGLQTLQKEYGEKIASLEDFKKGLQEKYKGEEVDLDPKDIETQQKLAEAVAPMYIRLFTDYILVDWKGFQDYEGKGSRAKLTDIPFSKEAAFAVFGDPEMDYLVGLLADKANDPEIFLYKNLSGAEIKN